MFHFLRLGRLTWSGDSLRSCLDNNSVIVYWILNKCWMMASETWVLKNPVLQLVHMKSVVVRKTLVTLLLVRMNFVSAIHRLEHMTFVNLLRVRMTFATFVMNLQRVRMTLGNLQRVRMNVLELCESPARPHDALTKFTPFFLIKR